MVLKNVVKQLYLRKVNAIKNIKYNNYDFFKHNCLICKTILGENFHKKSYGNFCHSCHYASGAVEDYHYEMYYW
jgi:hypothetical protein